MTLLSLWWCVFSLISKWQTSCVTDDVYRISTLSSLFTTAKGLINELHEGNRRGPAPSALSRYSVGPTDGPSAPVPLTCDLWPWLHICRLDSSRFSEEASDAILPLLHGETSQIRQNPPRDEQPGPDQDPVQEVQGAARQEEGSFRLRLVSALTTRVVFLIHLFVLNNNRMWSLFSQCSKSTSQSFSERKKSLRRTWLDSSTSAWQALLHTEATANVSSLTVSCDTRPYAEIYCVNIQHVAIAFSTWC